MTEPGSTPTPDAAAHDEAGTAQRLRRFGSDGGLGAPESWPTGFAAVAGLVLGAGGPMALTVGAEGRLLVNAAAAELLGADADALLGAPLAGSALEAVGLDAAVLAGLLQGRAWNGRQQALAAPQNLLEPLRWLDLDASPLAAPGACGGNGRFAGGLVVLTDVTAQVRAEQVLAAVRKGQVAQVLSSRQQAGAALQESEARHRQILDSAVDYGIVAMDLRGRVTRWNEGARRIFGWREEEMLGEDLERIFTPEDRTHGQMRKEMVAALAREVGNDERWHLRQDGTRFWAIGEMNPLRDDAGRPVGFIKVLRDQTERHRADEALKLSEARLRRAQEAGGVGVFAVDLATDVVAPTAEFCRVFGIAHRETIPATELEALVLHDDARLRSTAASRRDSQAPLDVEYRIRRASDGAVRWVSRRAEYERDAQGRLLRMVGVVQDITERKAAHRALEASETQFRTFAQTQPNQAWTAQPDGKHDWFNQRVYEFTGTTAGTLDGEGWAATLHPEDRAPTRERWAAAVAGGTVYEAEFRIRRADGEHRWHLARALPVLDAEGAVARWVGSSTDVHERKLAAVASLRDRDRIWALSQELMLVGDFADRILAVNPSATRILGWSEAELIGRKVGEFLHPDDREASMQERDRLARGHSTRSFENRWRTRGGDYRLLDWTAVPDGGLVHGVARDVTAERETAAERERIWAATNDLMASTDAGLRLKAANPAWARLLGAAEAELAGADFCELVDADDQARTRAALAPLAGAAARDGAVAEFESRLVHRDGARSLVAWSAERRGGTLYIVGRDVTEQRQVEEALRQSQKMEAVGQLTGGIAHDFNNLLQGITGSLDTIQRRLARGRYDGLDGLLAGAMSSAQRAASLTHRLLAFSRRQPLHPRAVAANPLLASMDDLLRRTLGESVRLEIALEPGLWPTRCDPNQLENALLNLVINARDAMPAGGRLLLQTANAVLGGEAGTTSVPAADEVAPGEYVCIAVSDTGTGMSADTAARAFEPFFTTKPIGQGTGLGLSMIYGFARQSGGHVEIASALGAGTTVRIYLPRAGAAVEEPAAVAPTAVPDDALPAARAGACVLVVEDEAVVRELVLETLRELGYRVLAAADGPAGLAVLHSPAAIDLLVTDVGLPGLNGRQIADAGRARRPGLKVLFMTGYAEHAVLDSDVLEAGMAVIAKPFALETLAATVRAMLEG